MELSIKAGMIAAVAAGLALASAQATAEIYAGIGIGSATIEASDTYEDAFGNSASLDFESDDTSFKVYGGFMFTEYVGVELSYHDFGEPSDGVGFDGGQFGNDDLTAELDVEATGFSGQVVLQYPLGPVDLFGKAGFILADVEADASITRDSDGVELASISEDDTGSELMWGVGARYTAGQFAIRAEYEIIDADELDDFYALSIGVEYNFEI